MLSAAHKGLSRRSFAALRLRYVFARQGISSCVANVNDEDEILLDDKQDAIFTFSISEQEFAQLHSDVLCLRSQSATQRASFQNLDASHKLCEPASTRDSRTLPMEPAENLVHVPLSFGSQMDLISHINLP